MKNKYTNRQLQIVYTWLKNQNISTTGKIFGISRQMVSEALISFGQKYKENHNIKSHFVGVKFLTHYLEDIKSEFDLTLNDEIDWNRHIRGER